MIGANLSIPVTISAALVAGMTPALLAASQRDLKRQLGLPEDRPAGLLSILYFTLVPMALVSGLILDQWGVGEGLISGALVLAVGLAFLAGSQTLVRTGMAIVLMAAGGACLAVGSCVLMPTAFFIDNVLAATCLGTLFLSLAALVTPPLARRLLRLHGVRQSLLGLALVPLIPGLLAVFLPALDRQLPTIPLGQVLQSPVLWLAALGTFLYFPLETILASRSSQYLAEMTQRPEGATAAALRFWLSFLAARLASALLLSQVALIPKQPEPWVVLVLALLLAVVLGNLAGSASPRSAGWGLVLAGASLGPIWPALLALALRRFPEEGGLACGTLWAFGMLGSTVQTLFPRLTSSSPQPSNALRLPMALALLLAGIALVLVLVS
jgi:fucose permease